jgi:YidC/Oxa1 family membrane protein insertase
VGLDRNQITGIILLFGIFMLWTTLNAPTEEEMRQKRAQDTLAHMEELIKTAEVENPESTISNVYEKPVIRTDSVATSTALISRFGPYANSASGEESFYVLENDLVIITFSSLGGVVKDVMLKDYQQILLDENREEYKIPLHLLNDEKNIFEYIVPVSNTQSGVVKTSELYFDAKVTENSIVFTARADDGSKFVQSYTLQSDGYTLDYDVNISGAGTKGVGLNWITYLGKVEKNSKYEKYYTSVYYKEVDEDVDYCSCRKSDVEDLTDSKLKWVSHSNQFFNAALIAKDRFGGAQLETEMLEDDDDNLKILRSLIDIPLEGRASELIAMSLYVGPNEFTRLREFDVALEDVIPFGSSIFGTINRWIIRPIFNFLLGFIGSKGIVILVLTLVVKVVLYPLMLKMLHSQAKMSALKPKMAHLKEKFKDDSQGLQMETMKIYREYGVSPLGGCLPMVAQMPIWFALYRFFPASIEFRQASFLWATDLSSYDVFVNLPWDIPFYGQHVSLLTLLWAGTTIIYTYYNTKHMDMNSMNPMMKYMQYFMPVMFLFFFNNYASGLTLYLFYSNVLNIGLTIGTKKLLFDEDKLREQLEEKKKNKKPKKKGGFQDRLEKAMAEQKKITDKKQNSKKK